MLAIPQCIVVVILEPYAHLSSRCLCPSRFVYGRLDQISGRYFSRCTKAVFVSFRQPNGRPRRSLVGHPIHCRQTSETSWCSWHQCVIGKHTSDHTDTRVQFLGVRVGWRVVTFTSPIDSRGSSRRMNKEAFFSKREHQRWRCNFVTRLGSVT